MEERRTGRGEAAGHMMAELFEAKDEWRHGRMTTDELKRRVAVIRHRQRAFNSQYMAMRISNTREVEAWSKPQKSRRGLRN